MRRDRLDPRGLIVKRYIFAVAIVVTWSGISFGQAKRVDDAALRNAAKSASDADWLSYGLTPGETRYSPLTQIDASNVKRLGLVWSYERRRRRRRPGSHAARME